MGSPRIDAYAAETCDTAYIDGHYYAAKAPGLALASFPWYGALRLAGLAVGRAPRASSWPRRCSSCRGGRRGRSRSSEPRWLRSSSCCSSGASRSGSSPNTALQRRSSSGLAPVLPFSTLFFAHVLAATLGFAAFWLLLRDRRSAPPAVPAVVVAGALAGLAIVVEFPLGIVAIALAVYAGRERVLPYAVGVGVLPLALFNTWAFGSPLDLSYENAVIDPGATGTTSSAPTTRGCSGDAAEPAVAA